MKKALEGVIAVLVVALVLVVAYYEINFPSTEYRAAKINDEKILTEMPDLELSEADIAFGQKVLLHPEVIAAMEQSEGADLPLEPAEELFADYLPDGAEAEHISVFQNAVYCGYLEHADKRVMLTFFKDDAYGPYKTIALYQGDSGERSCKVVYENQAGELRKMEPHRRWFAYFRDRMWED
nr:hypothetical protein [uncultured Oscillibacter sp.]